MHCCFTQVRECTCTCNVVQKWENALLEHISYSLHIGGRVIDDDKDEEVLPLGCLEDTLRVGFYFVLCNGQISDFLSAGTPVLKS